MLGIVLSFFDTCEGPKVLLKFPSSIEKTEIAHIPNLMDVFDKGFIVYELDELKTANYVFETNNPITRGRRDTLMLSLISHHERYHLNLNSFREIIEVFVKKLKKKKDLYKAIPHSNDEHGAKDFKKLKKLVYSFYNCLPTENHVSEPNLKKKLTFELSTLGKSEILSQLKNNKSIS